MNSTPCPLPVADDAIALLAAGHADITRLFDAYEDAPRPQDRAPLVALICRLLGVHAQIEEEILYPALRDGPRAPGAPDEQAGVRSLVAQLAGLAPDSPAYDARVRVLSAHVKHLMRREQAGLFARARATSLDLYDLGDRMAARKADLMARAA